MPNLDEQLLLWFNGYHTPWLDSLMMTITGRWEWIPLYVILTALLFYRCGWRRALVYLVGVALTITLTDQICASLIRPEIARLRPCDVDNPLSAMVHTVNGYAPQSYSFPSCHAANTFALAMLLSLACRNRGITWFMFLWAALVSYSRLYLGVHHPADILAGAIIGMTIAVGVYWLTTKIKFGRKEALAIALLLSLGAQAQKFEWGGEFATIFDNREGNAKHTPAQTYFLTRLAPEVGVSFKNRTHRVMAGAVYTQPIGCEWDGHHLSPTLYYRYNAKHLKGSMGMFPRTQLIRPLPEYLVSDSTRYFQHNLRGALLQYTDRRGFFELLCDWRGMQTASRREAFAVIAQGEWCPRKKIVRIGGTAMLNHLAKVKNAPADQYVVDNLVANAWAGLDLTHCLRHRRHWRALSIRAGVLSSLTRDRADSRWRSAVGLRAELDATFWRFTLRNVFWAGNRPLYPVYDKFGPQLNEGEPYYSSSWYNRTEISGLLVSYKNIIDLRAELDFHWADKSDFMFYQRLILTVKI